MNKSKTKQLVIKDACLENWDKMVPEINGMYCGVCAKTVVDLTNMNPHEIADLINNSESKICGRLTKSQLNFTLYLSKQESNHSFPYSRIAAGVLIATTLVLSPNVHSTNSTSFGIEFVKNNSTSNNQEESHQKIFPTSSEGEFITIEGRVMSPDNSTPIINAKISFCAANRVVVTFSGNDGSFTMEVPIDLMDDANVLHVSYSEIKKRSGYFDFPYESEDLILDKNGLTRFIVVRAVEELMILGEVDLQNGDGTAQPLVIENGVEIDYNEFVKAQLSKESTCNLKGKVYYQFHEEAAVAIYGERARGGLFIIYPE